MRTRFMWFTRTKLIAGWIGIVVCSVLVALAFVASGRLADCKPGQIDGQCGLSTFLGMLYGAAAGFAILTIGTALILWKVLARRRARKSG